MHLDTRQLRLIAAKFRKQHALEVFAKGLFYGLFAALLVILADKVRPFPVTYEPGILALGGGLLVGALAGLLALRRRFVEAEAARAVDAHFALQEQIGSAKEFIDTPSSNDFEVALAAQANALAQRDYAREFRLRAPKYTNRASMVGACAVLLLFAPPLNSFLPGKRAEMAELKAKQAGLVELSRELKEINPQDKKLEELSQELKDLAVRAQKNRLTKEDFLKELDEIQRQLEAQKNALGGKETGEALKELEQSLDNLGNPEVNSAKDLAAKMEALKAQLDAKGMKFDDLDKLEKALKEQQESLSKVPELAKLNKELGDLRTEALKQQDEKLKGEVGKLLDQLKQETDKLDQKTPSALKNELQQQAKGLQQEHQQGQLDKQDLQPMKQGAQKAQPHDPSAASKMEGLLNKLEKALAKDGQLKQDQQAQQQQNEKNAAACENPGNKPGEGQNKAGEMGKNGPQSEKSGAQQGQQGQGGQQQKPGEQAGQQGQSGKPGQDGQGQQGDGKSGSGQGQQELKQYLESKGQTGQGGQPMSGAPEMMSGESGGQPGNGEGSGSGAGEPMSAQEMKDWAEMLEQYKKLDDAVTKAGQCRGGSCNSNGVGNKSGSGGSSWGLGHDPYGSPSNQGGSQAPDEPGAQTQSSKLTLEDMDDFQAIYDPQLIDGKAVDSKVKGQIREGDSGGFTMIKAPETEEGDAVTPYFSVSPETAESEVQALEDQEIPANLKDLVREYFESLDQ
ncbi:MAG TPA: hypothetical protein VEI97_20735 [bacterium]|nr:hypothetical protein [bacterium]